MPQKRFPVEAKIGLFVVVALIALVIVTTQVNQSGMSFRSMKTYFLQFQNVSGLLESAPVEYAGLRVGRVDSFQLDEKSGAILVKIKVEKNFSLYEDSIVELVTRGLLGEKIIMIQGGGKAPVIPEGGVIKAFRSSSGLEEAMQSFNDIS
ncbi:MAG: MlaD family protein, partial [Bdellovibrionota bacterium]